MTIEKSIRERMNIARFAVAERYFSRRNTVSRIDAVLIDGTDMTFVYKEYNCGDIGKEADVLARLDGKRVPRLLVRGQNALCLAYLRGDTVQQALEDMERRGQPPYAVLDGLVDFLAHFYAAMPGHIYGDVNLRNFIGTPDGICGVDLEETRAGVPYTDIGRMAAFLLTYRPAQTAYKQDAAAYLIRTASARLGIGVQAAQDAMQDELAAMQMRRNKK